MSAAAKAASAPATQPPPAAAHAGRRHQGAGRTILGCASNSDFRPARVLANPSARNSLMPVSWFKKGTVSASLTPKSSPDHCSSSLMARPVTDQSGSFKRPTTCAISRSVAAALRLSNPSSRFLQLDFGEPAQMTPTVKELPVKCGEQPSSSRGWDRGSDPPSPTEWGRSPGSGQRHRWPARSTPMRIDTNLSSGDPRARRSRDRQCRIQLGSTRDSKSYLIGLMNVMRPGDRPEWCSGDAADQAPAASTFPRHGATSGSGSAFNQSRRTQKPGIARARMTGSPAANSTSSSPCR
jgi:hypothetical protein